jgi:hypothetical protein
MKEPIFSETQRSKPIWFWAILILVLFPILREPAISLISTVYSDDGASVEVSYEGKGFVFQIISILLGISLISYYLLSNLKTSVSPKGISVKFWPMMSQYKYISWEEIDKVFLRKYKPLDDYGGWGIKHGKKGKSLTVRGHYGLQLIKKSGEKLLIGTQKNIELQEFLEKYIYSKFDFIIK